MQKKNFQYSVTALWLLINIQESEEDGPIYTGQEKTRNLDSKDSKEANHSISSLGFRVLQILSDGSQHLWSRDHSLLFTIINIINWLTMRKETQLCELNKRRQRFPYRWFDLGKMIHKLWSLGLGNFSGPRRLLYYLLLVPLFPLSLDTEFAWRVVPEEQTLKDKFYELVLRLTEWGL